MECLQLCYVEIPQNSIQSMFEGIKKVGDVLRQEAEASQFLETVLAPPGDPVTSSIAPTDKSGSVDFKCL